MVSRNKIKQLPIKKQTVQYADVTTPCHSFAYASATSSVTERQRRICHRSFTPLRSVQDDRRSRCKAGSLFQSLVGKDVNGDADGKQNEKKAEGPMLGNEDGAVEQRNPHHAD